MSSIKLFRVLSRKITRLNPTREGTRKNWLMSISTGIASINHLLRKQAVICFSGKEIISATNLSSFPGKFRYPVEYECAEVKHERIEKNSI